MPLDRKENDSSLRVTPLETRRRASIYHVIQYVTYSTQQKHLSSVIRVCHHLRFA